MYRFFIRSSADSISYHIISIAILPFFCAYFLSRRPIIASGSENEPNRDAKCCTFQTCDAIPLGRSDGDTRITFGQPSDCHADSHRTAFESIVLRFIDRVTSIKHQVPSIHGPSFDDHIFMNEHCHSNNFLTVRRPSVHTESSDWSAPWSSSMTPLESITSRSSGRPSHLDLDPFNRVFDIHSGIIWEDSGFRHWHRPESLRLNVVRRLVKVNRHRTSMGSFLRWTGPLWVGHNSRFANRTPATLERHLLLASEGARPTCEGFRSMRGNR
jgi:hypothetical protein